MQIELMNYARELSAFETPHTFILWLTQETSLNKRTTHTMCMVLVYRQSAHSGVSQGEILQRTKGSFGFITLFASRVLSGFFPSRQRVLSPTPHPEIAFEIELTSRRGPEKTSW